MRTSKPCRAVLWLAATFFLVYLYHTINHRSLLPGAGKPSRPSVSAQGDWAAEKAEVIKDAFRFSWAQYERFAAPHDTLRPVSRSFEDDRNGWGATAVDGLSTAILMEEREIVDKILRQIASTDFSKTAVDDQAISVFESTIRYLGGLLSGYDLLTGPFAKLSEEPQLVNVLLEKAVTLADRLSIAFDTPSGVPDDEVIFNPKPHRLGNRDSSITCIGTLVLEWTRLSDLTGNTTYAALAQRAQNHLLRPKYNGFKFPGLLGTYVRLTDGEFEDYQAGWGGGSDSYYEYLIKMFAYDPVAFAEYRDNWVAAAESSMRYLASSPTSRSDLTFLGEFRDNTTVPISSHLASVCGGSFILGGLLLQDQAFIDFGLELAKSYYEVYRQSPSGIGPETFRWVDDHQATSRRTASLAPPKKWTSFYEVAGYWSTSPEYILRPETIESLYYAYRATGDRKWQLWAWEAFEALEARARVAGGYSGLHTTMKSEQEVGDAMKYRVDKMESFWLAETLKYLYMIFGNDDEYQVKQGGRWVLNTEAHPLRARDRSK